MSRASNRVRFVEPRGFILIALLVGVWALAGVSRQTGVLPNATIVDTVSAASSLIASGTLWEDYTASLTRVVIGFGIGALAGLAVGVTLGVSRSTDRLLGPLVTALRQVPIFGLVPLLGLWFGTGETAKLALVAIAAFFPATLNTQEALRNVPAKYRDVATLYRMGPVQTFRRVLGPCALPGILTGLKHGLSFAWIAVVGAELFLAAAPGLGNLLEAGREQFRIDIITVGIVLIAGTGGLMNALVATIERHLLRWRPAFA